MWELGEHRRKRRAERGRLGALRPQQVANDWNSSAEEVEGVGLKEDVLAASDQIYSVEEGRISPAVWDLVIEYDLSLWG